jgi:hypothetical protein
MVRLSQWIDTTQEGKGHYLNKNIGIIDGKVVFTQIKVRTTV